MIIVFALATMWLVAFCCGMVISDGEGVFSVGLATVVAAFMMLLIAVF